MPENFFMSEEIFQQILGTISRIENSSKNQAEINKLWIEIKDMFLNEMSRLPDLPSSDNSKLNKNRKKSQKFWNDDLSKLWKDTCHAEKAYTSFRVKTNADLTFKRNLREQYKIAQKLFDKNFVFINANIKSSNLLT